MKLYNTLTMTKEEFEPLEEGKVKMYVCGPTVYDFIHIGNARPLIVFDTLRRYFEYKGYEVIYIQNFTDVEDKMINRANKEGVTVFELAERFIQEYYKDADRLNVKRATKNPRATEEIEDMIALIQTLIDKGYAYVVDGDVYFRTRKFAEYGKLSHKNIEELMAGARVDPNEKKEDPLDFALWKAKKEGEPAWSSPWGEGRPGWHIECSVMAMKYLGQTIDIHAGGQDLIFPHHENEIAQSEASTGKPFARFWLHNGYVNINNEKMSKSLGNFFTVREIIEKYHPEALRLFMLQAHYRKPLNFSIDLIEQAESALKRIYTCYENLEYLIKNGTTSNSSDSTLKAVLKELKAKFIDAMEDDLNTAEATGYLFEMVREINTHSNTCSKDVLILARDTLKELCSILGILEQYEEKKDEIPPEILELVEKRNEARKAKNFLEADRIRDDLRSLGYIVLDTPQGTKIERIK
ncbi:cysteinyl-tRNA synthetase [Caldicellulosiruptor kronotskyensis 2002]|uniref:Cysteine--tRNA ligase n=1 Tax=Caldicellulosiruptor kronotskyensis (strain DSM 18902 / VKM B-2412 / 2002) TaxID=632348 RepID=E4SE08_CALK2|nr:cysteine--tRNA ligase [Caldicellulosiruptor kronotskyensis]ADQ45295.1 cysteinyl-tRNA synthetase [Caldicellulosiruptor kronotskyensis 2002]